MTTNLLVKGLCKITTQITAEPVALANNYSSYAKMHEISVDSFKQNLQGSWELIELSEEQENIQTFYKNILVLIKKLWHENKDCNILYSDADTLCVKPLSIFGTFQDFRVFTDNDPPKGGDYFNGGVKYYPSSLSKEFWDEIDLIIDNWDYTFWDYEQKAHTDLMLAQPEFDSTISQEWVVKQIGFSHRRLLDELNLDNLNNTKQSILHFHSSQNPQFRVECMKTVWDKMKND